MSNRALVILAAVIVAVLALAVYMHMPRSRQPSPVSLHGGR
ncbi:MAG TPA: hypothetical protein VGY57_16875 [Vicinamibacterales bacterium]|nr:hypothetical protein [Vicinamibacterales bacterium]